MKGQINIEFLTAAMLYLIALGGVFLAGDQILPSFHGETERTSLNLESKAFTYEILTYPGSHTEGSDWEQENNIENIESFGLAQDYFELDRGKIESLTTFTEHDEESTDLNYTEFRSLTDLDNEYRFVFTWMPLVHTHESFIRGSPPENPAIIEPCDTSGAECESGYNEADNRVHYGSTNLEGLEYNFLVTVEDGVYNGLYVSNDWEFEDEEPLRTRDTFEIYDTEFTIESFQNRENEEGSLVVLSKELNEFGPSIDSDVSVQRVERFASMEEEPLRVEVWTW